MNELNKVFLENDIVKLEYANLDNVDILIKWTLDPIAQGPYKVVPNMTKEQLKELFLYNSERYYFLIKNKINKPIGRFYYRAWFFNRNKRKIDWELNIIIANPNDRGKGYGSATQLMVTDYLRRLPETNSVFAYTLIDNLAEQKSLEKCGFRVIGTFPNDYYKIHLNSLKPEDFLLLVVDES